MELRVLQYFLAIAREQSISGAAEFLHVSQPTLSRQIRDMEDELGKQLFIRGNRKITLTEEGMILRKRSEEILGLVKKTEDEIALSDDISEGDIYIGAGETHALHILADSAKELQKNYPNIRIHIASGDTTDVLEELDKGLIDFGLLFGSIDKSKYEYLELPVNDTYGILMRKDSELAEKDVITPEDLWNRPLICNRNAINNEDDIYKWMKKDQSEVNIIATYNLLYNASILVVAGIGYAIALDKIINVTGDSSLCFRPLYPSLDAGMSLVWKKYQIFSKAAEKYLIQMQKDLKK
ncbi:LysR family transcriptional regulator [[Clostridium] innocuum]|nr:LysR family transcriptional regulator [[Clostridium] innocuum]MCR0413775.1 LysR family transcriptional regulator [[Clostridium] innocuum]MCR0534677.1 LysR family transcriptional regulator [[Clostridium] innocuum]MCR0538799.1 LysR family transcriptional regulator [[Clostridium] innocuum]MDU1119301.1 LysR family transcriptional regulator [Erysipelotrichaceae bacterium]